MPQGLVKNNPANDPDKKPVKARSHFKPNVSVYQTVRFGEATPFYGAEVVPDDENFSIRVNSDVDTLTLKSPLMAPVRMNKDYFFVPLRAILPFNADKVITNPLTGDDVVAKNVNCVVRPRAVAMHLRNVGVGSSGASTFLENLKSFSLDADSGTPVKTMTHFIGHFFTFYRRSWYFLSEGSVLRNLGYNFHQLFKGPQRDSGVPRLTFDQFCELYFDYIAKNVKSFSMTVIDGVSAVTQPSDTPNFNTTTYYVSPGMSPDDMLGVGNISLRQLIFILQQGSLPLNVSNVVLTDAGIALGDSLFPFLPWGADEISSVSWRNWDINQYDQRNGIVPRNDENSRYVNLSRVVGYQLACVQFYTSDAVDYLYTCDLWHDNLRALAQMGRAYDASMFRYNGVSVPYDGTSGFYIERELTSPAEINYDLTSSYWVRYSSQFVQVTQEILSEFYFANLLGFVRSLKFRDYFVGSKKSPLAVGGVNVTVQNGEFSVVDVTENILRQRFLNQVNRIGRTLKEYSQGIFGATPMRDPHEVVFLGSTTDVIGAEETQNTGNHQFQDFSMSSRLRSESSKFAFEGSFSESGVVVGILTFDVARPYVNSCDRALFHVDRYDMFNPFMQNIGDQAVYGEEVDLNQGANFGYQLRYMEYRQRVDLAAGGFHKFLPGYSFLADDKNIAQPGKVNVQISPDFIRSRSYEFDAFYVALPYYTPAAYFHFIIRHDIDVDINRPMLAAPSIL